MQQLPFPNPHFCPPKIHAPLHILWLVTCPVYPLSAFLVISPDPLLRRADEWRSWMAYDGIRLSAKSLRISWVTKWQLMSRPTCRYGVNVRPSIFGVTEFHYSRAIGLR